jgi:uncharacterized membrane protein YhdT
MSDPWPHRHRETAEAAARTSGAGRVPRWYRQAVVNDPVCLVALAACMVTLLVAVWLTYRP